MAIVTENKQKHNTKQRQQQQKITDKQFKELFYLKSKVSVFNIRLLSIKCL